MQALLNIIFPKNCIFCQKKGSYICEDCFSLIEINPFQFCICGKSKKTLKCNECSSCLDGLFVCTKQNQIIIDKIINKYSNIKDLSYVLSLIILTHFLLLKKDDFSNFIIYPLPQDNIKRIGFDKTKEIGKIISNKLKIPLMENVNQIKNKNILLLDLIYTNKMEDIAKQLKPNQIMGLVITKH